MYRALRNDSIDRRILVTSRQQPYRLIVVTMVLVLKLFATNTLHYKRQSHCTMALFASGFTPGRPSTFSTTGTVATGTSSTRPTQTQPSQLVARKILPTFDHMYHQQRKESFFTLSDTSGRIDEPLVVLEAAGVNEAISVPSEMIPSLLTASAIATPKPPTMMTSPTDEINSDVTLLNDKSIRKNHTAASSRHGTVIITDDAEFVRPDRDLRSYRFIQLSNNLQCLLVCDNMQNGVGIEAASVHVKAGHFDDTIPGLARTLFVDTFNLSLLIYLHVICITSNLHSPLFHLMLILLVAFIKRLS